MSLPFRQIFSRTPAPAQCHLSFERCLESSVPLHRAASQGDCQQGRHPQGAKSLGRRGEMRGLANLTALTNCKCISHISNTLKPRSGLKCVSNSLITTKYSYIGSSSAPFVTVVVVMVPECCSGTALLGFPMSFSEVLLSRI